MLAPCARLEDNLEFVGSLIGLTLFLSFFRTWGEKIGSLASSDSSLTNSTRSLKDTALSVLLCNSRA